MKHKLRLSTFGKIFYYTGCLKVIQYDNGHQIQKARLLHPFSWIILTSAFILGIFIQGIPETVNDIKDLGYTWI